VAWITLHGMNRAELRVSVARTGEETVIAVAGQLDLSTVDALSDAVTAELRDSPGRLILDFAGLTFCDSRGLGTLVVLQRAARTQRTYLAVRNPSPFFSRMLDVTGMGPILMG
jgi:anti-sigma B factor antagonist